MMEFLDGVAWVVGWACILGLFYFPGLYLFELWKAYVGEETAALRYYSVSSKEQSGEYMLDFVFILPFVWLTTFRSTEIERRRSEFLSRSWIVSWERDKQAGRKCEGPLTASLRSEMDRQGWEKAPPKAHPVLFRKVSLCWKPRKSRFGLFGLTEKDLVKAGRLAPPIPHMAEEERLAHKARAYSRLGA